MRASWREYLRSYNHGRGVVLLSHSQGTRQLRQLLTDEIEPKASSRRLLISAMLLGGNVTVRRGSLVGGDFRRTPACRSARQFGCVVAYSSFNERFRPRRCSGARPSPSARCCARTRPRSPAGSGVLRAYVPTAAFPGTLGLGIRVMLGELPKVSTPWIGEPRSYRARCSSAGGTNVLQVNELHGARRLPPIPDANWGLHLADVNIALGTLVASRAARRQRGTPLAEPVRAADHRGHRRRGQDHARVRSRGRAARARPSSSSCCASRAASSSPSGCGRCVKDPALHVDPRAEALLYAAARAQLVAERVRPLLEAGDGSSSTASSTPRWPTRARGRGLGVAEVRAINEFGTAG